MRGLDPRIQAHRLKAFLDQNAIRIGSALKDVQLAASEMLIGMSSLRMPRLDARIILGLDPRTGA